MGLFGTAGIRGDARTNVTPSLAQTVGRAVASHALDCGVNTVVVGRDGRETGAGLAAAVTAGLTSGGVDVERIGVVPTPCLAHASRGRHGVMLTASHNPPTDNGIKCFVDGVEYDREAERAVEGSLDREPVAWDEWGDERDAEHLERYLDAVVGYGRSFAGAERPLEGLTVAVDCGGGMGSLATPQSLRRLGARPIALNASVDGHFSARPSKPTPETLSSFTAFVADGDADFGLAHDGDADRIVVCEGDGEIVHEDTVLAILAGAYVERSGAADPVVVTTPNASGRIDERVAAAGGRVERVRLGALHEGIAGVRASGEEGTSVVFAAEPWKHIHPAFGGWIDGVASAGIVAALVADAGGLDALREPITEQPYRKVSVDCPDDDKARTMAILEDRLPSVVDGEVDTDHGVRIDRSDGSWLLVRPSGTEPYVRIYAESDAVDDLIERARAAVEEAIATASS